MLFAVSFTPRSGGSEERDKRTLNLFTQWKPPAGYEFKAFYDYADGDGGIAIVDASSAEVMLEAHAPWATFFLFTIRPIVDVEKSTPILQKSNAWRDSIR
ncbi:MAG TPA: DUF3303 family protein [Vicinamibacterales bacterium]|nr:DUF3303 family protein [Vicinamibacterales bacterium]